jgi:hypothetical protein
MKREKTCKEVILEHINSTQGWINKGELYGVAQKAEFSPESGAREARRLEEKGFIQKSFYDGKYATGLVRYSRLGESKPIPQRPKLVEIERNGERIMVYA